jgi:PAS domain S-box-containing protein
VNQNRYEEIVPARSLDRRRVWPAWGILMAAIILTALVTLYMKTDVDVQAKREFLFACNEIRCKIDDRLQEHQQILLSGAAFFDASDKITREQWRIFTQRLNVKSNLPGIQGIGFALLIPPDRLAQHVQDIRNEGFPNYAVRPEGNRGAYSSIIYLEPFLERNLRAFGYDMLSEPVRLAAMERARDQNATALSGKVVLVQETEKDIQAGTLMYVPVYRKGMPIQTIEQRREALFGWVYSPYRMTDLMRGILGGWDSQEGLRIRLQVYDGARPFPESILYDSHTGKDPGLAPQFTEELQVVFNGSPWTLRFTQTDGQVALAKVWLTLAGGIIISLLVFGLALSLLNSRSNARRMAERLTAELRLSEERWQFALEGSRDGVWDWNAQTNEVFFSRQWKAMIGYEEHEIGTAFDEWDKRVHSDDKDNCYADLKRHLSGEIPFYENEHRLLCKDGNYKWILARGKVSTWTEDGKPLRVIGTHTDINERKRMEDAIHQRQENFRAFFDTMDDVIVVGDSDGRIIHTNSTALRKLGYTPDELKTMHVLDLNPRSQRQEAERIFKEMLEGKRDICPLPLERKDGTLIPVENRIWFGKWSGMDCVFGICKDLSKEQEALQKFNRLFDFNPNPLAVGSIPEGKFVEINESFLTTLGFSRDEVIGRTPGELDLFVDPEAQEIAAQRIVDGSLIRNIELQLRKKDGGIVEGLFSGTVIDSQGEKFLLTVMLDVTDRKAAEAFLKESEVKFRTFVDFTDDWDYWINPDGSMKYISPSCEKITGYPAEDFINNPDMLDSIVYPGDQEKWAHHRQGITSACGSEDIDFRIVDRNGRIVWIAHNCLGVFGPDGAWLGRRASNRDISERINAENEVAKHLSMIEGILANAAEGICVCHSIEEFPFASFTHWNERMTETTGYSMDEINRLGWYQSMYPDPELQNRAVERMSRMRVGDNLRGEEWVITTKGGQARPVLISTTLMTDAKGANHVLAVMHDITDRKHMEEERLQIERKLLHAQKLESLGVMAGGIAHDFNNQLAVVLGNLELGLMDQTIGPETRHSIESAVGAARRSAELSRQMQVYTGNIVYYPVDLDLNELLNSNHALLKSTVSKYVALNLETNSALPIIKGDAEQLQRMVINILVNASEALADKDGNVTLRTGVLECDSAYLGRSLLKEKPAPGRFIFLEVSDTGCGMDTDTQRRLLDPFFSTKFTGRGLGMAEVMGITKGHQGAIIVESEVGKGTTVRVLFPALEKAAASPVQVMDLVETKAPEPETGNRRKTILVVEDEEGVRNLVVRRLDVLGYDSIIAEDGEEGVRIFRERMNEIDLVMLDFKMPKMDGVEAFWELIRIKPDVKVILSSGYTEDVVLERFPGPRPAGILHKPYKMEELKGALE